MVRHNKDGSKTRSKRNRDRSDDSSSVSPSPPPPVHRSRIKRHNPEVDNYRYNTTGRQSSAREDINQRTNEDPSASESISVESKGAGDSISVEETNRIRAQLGLKPLETSRSRNSTSSTTQPKDDVHAPPSNISKLKDTEKLRAKVQAQREKRKLMGRYENARTLGDGGSDDEDDVKAWVARSRKLEVKRREAKVEEEELRKMEEEFGLDRIVKQVDKPTYGSSNLEGLKVDHSMDRFQEGSQMILTLKDSGVLDEEEDTLMNVNLWEREKTEKNLDLRKKKKDYNPYDNDELDELGMPQLPSILSKYDDEVSSSFKLGVGVSQDVQQLAALRRIKEEHERTKVSLQAAPLRLALDTLSKEEMERGEGGFRKQTRRVKRLRKRVKPLRADDLVALGGAGGADHGRRDEGGGRIPFLGSVAPAAAEGTESDSDLVGPEADCSGVRLVEEADVAYESALARTRRLLAKDFSAGVGAERVAHEVRSRGAAPTGAAYGAMELDSVAEFCRTLGDNQVTTEENPTDEMVEELDEDDPTSILYKTNFKSSQDSWNPEGATKKPDTQDILTEKPMDQGIASALKLADKKGFIEKEKKVFVGVRKKNLPSEVGVEDPAMAAGISADFEDKFERRNNRYGGGPRGPVQDFVEKRNYKPDPKIEYADDSGRLLNQKEAFRYLSHKFHGKGSGKIKIERRSKKLQEQELLRKMASTDTPLQTVATMRNKQEQLSTPYLVLSGTNNTFTGGAACLVKDKRK